MARLGPALAATTAKAKPDPPVRRIAAATPAKGKPIAPLLQ
jgi:hypothetical protein